MELRGAVNVYVCQQCRRPLATILLESGVTPALVRCPACRGLMESCAYEIVPVLAANKIANIQVTHVWFRPTELPRDPTERDFLLRGGLKLRNVQNGFETAGLTDVTLETLQKYYKVKVNGSSHTE